MPGFCQTGLSLELGSDSAATVLVLLICRFLDLHVQPMVKDFPLVLDSQDPMSKPFSPCVQRRESSCSCVLFSLNIMQHSSKIYECIELKTARQQKMRGFQSPSVQSTCPVGVRLSLSKSTELWLVPCSFEFNMFRCIVTSIMQCCRSRV